MRSLKRLETGHFTLDTAAMVERTESLCENCGLLTCAVRAINDRLKVNKYGAVNRVTMCKSFIPILEFQDPAGLNGTFNTFRLGKAWAERLTVNQVVALASPKQRIGIAKVTASEAGPFKVMRDLRGHDNHLAIAAEIEEREFDLEEVMRKLYGPHRFHESAPVSVITMERIGNGVTHFGVGLPG